MQSPPETQISAPHDAGGGRSLKSDRLGVIDLRVKPCCHHSTADLTGALAFMAFWREQITERNERPGDIAVVELYDIPRDVAAWLRAARAFQEWRAL
jgi:hypothetical protein